MKAIYIFASLLSVIIINSCTTYYYVQTDVGRDLSVVRSVHTAGTDDGNVVFPFDPGGRSPMPIRPSRWTSMM